MNTTAANAARQVDAVPLAVFGLASVQTSDQLAQRSMDITRNSAMQATNRGLANRRGGYVNISATDYRTWHDGIEVYADRIVFLKSSTRPNMFGFEVICDLGYAKASADRIALEKSSLDELAKEKAEKNAKLPLMSRFLSVFAAPDPLVMKYYTEKLYFLESLSLAAKGDSVAMNVKVLTPAYKSLKPQRYTIELWDPKANGLFSAGKAGKEKNKELHEAVRLDPRLKEYVSSAQLMRDCLRA